MAEIQTFEPEGRRIPYAEDRRNGPALVLLPGEGLSVAYLGLLAEALAEEDFHVVRIGARRADETDQLTMHDLAQDVIDVMDHLGIARPWVGGHGFGGSLARTVSLDHPGRVGGVLLLGVEGEPSADAESEIPATARDAGTVALQQAARAASPEITWTSFAPAIPILVVQGAADDVCPPSNADAVRAASPERVSVVTIDGARDLFPLTHVGETAWPIEDYLDWD